MTDSDLDVLSFSALLLKIKKKLKKEKRRGSFVFVKNLGNDITLVELV